MPANFCKHDFWGDGGREGLHYPRARQDGSGVRGEGDTGTGTQGRERERDTGTGTGHGNRDGNGKC